MRGLVFLTGVLLLCGCAAETSEPGEEEPIGEHAGAVTSENSLEFNALRPNGIAPNGIAPNGIAPNGLTYSSLSPGDRNALADGGTAGVLSRMFIKYAVSCAFNSGDSFTYIDHNSANATVYGSLGLAPNWTTQGLTLAEQQWVSACIASRTNLYGVSVQISLRGNRDELRLEGNEGTNFPNREGAFWGNLFSASPAVYTCYDDATVGNSRSKGRYCATRAVDDSGCGLLVSVGRCDAAPSNCTGGATAGSPYSNCYGYNNFITTYLR